MTTIVTRAGKGSALTHNEVDANFTNLNDAKYESGNSASFTNLAYTGTLTGGTGVINIGSGQVYKDASGNVGIGTASPTQRLDVYNNAAASVINVIGDGFGATFQTQRYDNTATASFINVSKYRGSFATPLSVNSGDGVMNIAARAYGGTNTRPISTINAFVDTYTSDTNISGYMTFSTNSGGTSATERMRITSGGEVYIAGTTDQGAYNLQVNGTGVWGAGAYVNGSDARIKEDIEPISSSLDVVNKLNPVTYKYKENWTKDRSTQTGFIAQELLVALEGQNYVDGVVQQGGEYMSVAYQNIIPILTKAIQELNAKVEALEAQLNKE